MSVPDTLEGEYTVLAVNGNILPSVIHQDLGGWKVTVLSGELKIAGERYDSRTTVNRKYQGTNTVINETDHGNVSARREEFVLISEIDGSSMRVKVVDAGTLIGFVDLVSATVTYERK